MAAQRTKKEEAPVATVESAQAGAEAGETEVVQEPEVEEGRFRRRSKALAPKRGATPLRDRLRRRPSSDPGERRRPMQRSLLSKVTPEMMTQRAAKVGGGVILFVVLIVGVFVGYHFFAGSRFFLLRGVDVEGNSLLSVSEVEGMVQSSVPSGVLKADLTKIREKLEESPLIRQAQVIRLLPDRLRVRIVERTPITVARLADETAACVDENGAIFGDLNTWRGKVLPPLIRGLAESGERMHEINRQWIEIYTRLIADLDQNEPQLSSRIDEVIFDPDQGVRLMLANSRIIVLVGKDEFRKRLNAALDVIDAVKSKDAEKLNVLRIGDVERLLGGGQIKYLNVTDPNRVIVGLDE